MRTEKQMISLIVDVAKNDERIRAVILNGSRVDINIPKDSLQDFDIIYLVNEIETFSDEWTELFGKKIIMQKPEQMQLFESMQDGRMTYLMLFCDGNRIDLTLLPKNNNYQYLFENEFCIVLIDKDNIVEDIFKPSDKKYIAEKPTQKQFDDCCNEFWWVIQNVAKGIKRDEIPYAMYMFNSPVRNALHIMIEWYIGLKTDFSVYLGQYGKYYKNYLEKSYWSSYLKTYCDANPDNFWEAVFEMCNLFRILAYKVSYYLQFTYLASEEINMMRYLKRIKNTDNIKEKVDFSEDIFFLSEVSLK